MATRRNLLRRAANLVVVNDGANRWVGSQREIYGWLRRRDIARGFDRATNVPNSASLTESQYEAMCAGTVCLVEPGDYDLIGAIEDRGADRLQIA